MIYDVHSGPSDKTLEKSPQRGQFGDLAVFIKCYSQVNLKLVLNVNSYFHLWALSRALSVKS